jgi:hypothetical protein
MRLSCNLSNRAALACALAFVAASRATAEQVTIAKNDAGYAVTIGGKPFAEYMTVNGHQPIIWPILGPGGQAMTRQYPMKDKLPGEATDHPHHRSLWFNHGLVNKLDFWLEPGNRGKKNRIVQREVVSAESGDPAKLVVRNDWMSDDDKVCEDERTILFGADAHGRWIDFTSDVTATDGDVVFGDTKEGAFGLRVPGTMSVDAKKGGKIRNSRGQEDAVAWGQSAEWVDYSGPVDGKPAGIVVFDLPDSYRHPTRWHVRTYGLFAANPFGKKDFPADSQDPQERGEATVKKGEKLRVHYRVLFYDGEKSPAELAAIYKEYAAAKAN